MKSLFYFLTILVFPFSVFCQNNTLVVQNSIGGAFKITNTECLSPEARATIQKQNDENIARLEGNGAFTALRLSPQIVAFDWPLRQKIGFDTDPSYYGISNYVDQNSTAGIEDFNCASRTYDGHKGTDIFSWPFQWKRMDDNSIEIIAAEGGLIVNKINGFEDRHCACVNYDWNAICIRHSDNSIAWYGHMKNNTLTAKGIGQSIAKGEYLGVMGSSGCSTGPHLHFEVYNNANRLIDPFSGSCNALNPDSWWATQKPWREPTLNRLQLGTAPSVYGDCTTYKDITNEAYQYAFGSKIYVTAFFHDQSVGDITTYTIFKPDNSVATTWTHTSTSTYNASWWYWSLNLPSSSAGVWRVVASFKNQTVEKTFTLSPTVAVSQTADVEAKFYPMPFKNNLNLDYLSEGETRLEIIDMHGKVLKIIILQSQTATHTLPVSDLPIGVFIVKIKSNNQSFVKKIIKS